MGTEKCTRHVWNETIAGKGSNEISTCVWNFIENQVAIGKKEFYFYSDNCGGQNRNKITLSMFARAAVQFNVKIVYR